MPLSSHSQLIYQVRSLVKTYPIYQQEQQEFRCSTSPPPKFWVLFLETLLGNQITFNIILQYFWISIEHSKFWMMIGWMNMLKPYLETYKVLSSVSLKSEHVYLPETRVLKLYVRAMFNPVISAKLYKISMHFTSVSLAGYRTCSFLYQTQLPEEHTALLSSRR